MINSGHYVIGSFCNLFNHQLEGQTLDLWTMYALRRSFFCKLNYKSQYCNIYTNYDIKVLEIIKHLDHIATQKAKSWPSKPWLLLKVGHSITYLGNSMIFDPLLSTPRSKNYGGKNRDKGWEIM
jgi:hypothetical protein